jgi:DNA-binding beta-propeller fold protein YncE
MRYRGTQTRAARASHPSRAAVRRGVTAVVVAAVVALACVTEASAAVAAPENFSQFGEYGSGAGQLEGPVGIATNPNTGDVYVADRAENRVEEFSPWGNFIKAFGWGVADGASNELQTCTDTCFAGLPGNGAGQFNDPIGITVDSSGDVFVFELVPVKHEHEGILARVQKFDSAGRFLLMFGGEVDRTSHENVCTKAQLEGGDVCGPGTSGDADGQFEIEESFAKNGNSIASGPADDIYVADRNRIQLFESDGVYKSQIPLPGPGSGNPGSLTVDSAGDIYFVFAHLPIFLEGVTPKDPHVYELSPDGSLLSTLEVDYPGPVAVGPQGNVYVVEGEQQNLGDAKILEFDASGSEVATFDEVERLASGFPTVTLEGLGVNPVGDLYVTAAGQGDSTSYISAFGPPPVQFEPPPTVPPTITDEYAASVSPDNAVLKAVINPHFWEDTTYRVEYGKEDCGVAACASQPVAPGSKLTTKVVNAAVLSGGVFLSNLEPGTTYHYRFVSESGGGGPVVGAERTFTTFAEPARPDTGCANQAFRTGPSAFLPDCRAFELVSPIDKDNGDVLALPNVTGFSGELDQSAPSGEAVTYTSYRAYGGAQSAPYDSQYIATRDSESGWSSEAIDPPRGALFDDAFFGNEYEAFTPDLSNAWLFPEAEPSLAPGAVQGFPNLYRRDDLSGEYEALTTVRPPHLEPEKFQPELQGAATDGSCAVFRVDDTLTPEASSTPGIEQTYESCKGALSLVSTLPGGSAYDGSSSAGTADQFANYGAGVDHAVSADGSRVYWSTTNSGAGEGPGKLYLHVAGGETVKVSETVSTKAARFWDASPDGEKALFTVTEGPIAGNLYEFDLAEETTKLIAGKVDGLLGASEDLSYVYFVSAEALDGAAKAGGANLYVSHEGAISFIAALSSADTTSPDTPSAINTQPTLHAARVTPDGLHIAFVSTTSVTGYDNADVATGKPDSEVYTYTVGQPGPACVSCLPTGARPDGREVETGPSRPLATAASIPVWETQLYAPNVLSSDGSRLFFDSYEALVPRDTNGHEDVYEWEAASDGEECTKLGAELFSASNGGCLSLISSGTSPTDSQFVDTSATGGDVFFTTEASLVLQDTGLVDLYDARVGGGFPPPRNEPAACEGEACEGAVVAPFDPTPASALFSGPGDLSGQPAAAVAPKAIAPKHKTASQIKAEKLTKALKACRKKPKSRRGSCEAAARKRYVAAVKKKAAKSNKGGKRS